jgi:hypothetical protein
MIAAMQRQTRQKLIKLGIILICFTLLASLLSVVIRYKEMLARTITNQKTIFQNVGRMRLAAKDADKTVADFKSLLPPAYGTHTPEWLAYSRIDDLKSRLQATEMVVKAIENKEGMVSVDFTATLPLRDSGTYSRIINLLGKQETLAFPFVNVRSIQIDQSGSEAKQSLKLVVEGIVQMPAPQEISQ